MMDHLDEGALQALLDGELAEAEAAKRHLEACAACSGSFTRVVRASTELSAALALLDRQPPRPAPLRVPPTAAVGRGWRVAAVRRAAVILVSVAAAASATVPGSPVREWLAGQFEPSPQRLAVQERSAEAAARTEAVEAAVESGVMVEPANGELTIGLVRPAPNLRVRAMLTDGDRGGVFASGEAADARFITAAGRIEVVDAAGGELRIQIPRAARAASVEIDGRRYLEKQGDELRLTIAPGASGAAEILFHVQP